MDKVLANGVGGQQFLMLKHKEVATLAPQLQAKAKEAQIQAQATLQLQVGQATLQDQLGQALVVEQVAQQLLQVAVEVALTAQYAQAILLALL